MESNTRKATVTSVWYVVRSFWSSLKLKLLIVIFVRV